MQTLTHISASSVLLFLNNPAAWRTRYLLGIRDQKSTPAALTGSAFHLYAQQHLSRLDATKEQNKEVALAFMNSVTDVDFGKTGSLEKCQMDFNKLVDHFHAEKPRIGTVLGVEQEFLEKIPGIKLRIKAFIDLIHEDGQNLVITDWKTVSSYQDEPTPAQILQGCFYYELVKKAWKRAPARFDIVQIKASKNQDGGPQVRTISIDFLQSPHFLKGIKELTRLAVREMTRKRQPFLVNLRDDYEGLEEFKNFLASVSGTKEELK